MNAAFEKPLPERVLDESFNTFWPQLETKLKELLKKEAAETEKGSGNPVSSACTRREGTLPEFHRRTREPACLERPSFTLI